MGFDSSFSETVESIYETKTSFGYLAKPSSILVSSVSIAKLQSFEE